MKVDFSTVLTTLEGENMKEGFGEVKDVVTDYPCPKCQNILKVVMKDRGIRDLMLGSVCIDALMKPHEGDKQLTGDQKLERFALAGRIAEARKAEAPESAGIEIKPEEAAMLKKLLAEESVAVIGRAYPILDGK
jgi:hypothetical protein